ncbi:hypothetical protein [Bradyrhizobium japonicum]|uniref:hypothetical protein n=1 Tax=Bradyrhizobium japonicum TaxID=375 RepID=UPI002168A046|nr:hypothetical protein [Bradyrhizobium japonicum]MCS3533715.1 hypothetical protein [Bradyrhizobium japonicum]
MARAFELADHAVGESGLGGDVLDREAGALPQQPNGFAEPLVDRIVGLDCRGVLRAVGLAATIHVALPCIASPPEWPAV